jgi:hypothetical protein
MDRLCDTLRNGGLRSGEKGKVPELTLTCVLKPTVALHSRLKVTNSILLFGEGIDPMTLVSHLPNSSMNDQMA